MITRLFLLLVMALPVCAETQWEISAADWAKPRHGEWLVKHPALLSAISTLQQSPHTVLQLRYPGGDEGVLWVEELQAWLVALGVESRRIDTLPGSGGRSVVQLEVVVVPD